MSNLATSGLSTPGGLLLVLAILLPFVGVMVGLVLGGRRAQRVAWATIVLGLLLVAAIARDLLVSGESIG